MGKTNLKTECNVCAFAGKSDVAGQLEQATRETNDRLATLHSLEKQSLRNALIEERSRLCLFVTGLKPVMVSTS